MSCQQPQVGCQCSGQVMEHPTGPSNVRPAPRWNQRKAASCACHTRRTTGLWRSGYDPHHAVLFALPQASKKSPQELWAEAFCGALLGDPGLAPAWRTLGMLQFVAAAMRWRGTIKVVGSLRLELNLYSGREVGKIRFSRGRHRRVCCSPSRPARPSSSVQPHRKSCLLPCTSKAW